ncbi:MAG: hypothetical protein GYA14_07600, partial [Ignavibacteria bacterium]|nr:hypothetical protein [Ignavibacteria bacterium]
MPVISPASGPINSSQKITITCSTEGAQVYYKINEETATLYNGPFTITGDCTIKVTASKIGWTNSDVVTTTFTLNPELEISGTLPSNAINSPRTNINFAASIGSKGNTISVVRSDSENTEIGTVAVSGSTYTANIPINDSAYTAQIIIKDNLGRILFRNILGKTLIKSEIPSTTTKIKIPNINIDATSTAMALLVKEKNISVNKIVSISATDIQNGIATKTSTIANEISEQFSATPNLITEISKAVKTVSSTVLLTNVSTTTVPTSINSATELLSSFVKVVSEPNLQTIISQNQLTTSITLSADEQITSTTTIIEPILKVKMPIVEPLEWSNSLSALQITITSPSVGSTIYYTINGTTPSNSSILYSGPVTITDTTTIKAIAIKSGYTNSDVKSITFNKPSRILSAISTNLLYDYVNTESRYMLSSKDSNIKGKAYYSNNTSAEVSLNWTIKSGSGKLEFDNSTLYFYSSSSPGVTILTGSYTEGGITKTADFTIESKEIVPLYLNLQAVKKTNGDILITWITSQATSFKSTATIWSNDSIPLVDTIKTETLLTPTTQHSILYTAASIPASFTHIRITCFDNTITFFTFKNILKENIILKANSAPTISNIILSNSNGDVDIQFNIQDEDNDLCGVSLFYNAKNSASVEIPLNNIIGSTQYLVPGQTHKLKWIINNDLTGIYSTALYIYLIPYDSTNVGKGVSADPFAYTKWKLEKANTNFSPRNNHSSVVYNNKLWVIGGFYGEKLN